MLIMNKKIQLPLKTVQLEGWMNGVPSDSKPKMTLLTLTNSKLVLKDKRQSIKEGGRLHLARKKDGVAVKLNNLLIGSECFCERVEPDEQARECYKKFPKRQYSIKNSNPFRYFMHSTVRTQSQPREEEQFKIKLSQLMLGRPKVHRVTSPSRNRRKTQAGQQIKQQICKIRSKSIKSKQKLEIGPSPWELTQRDEHAYHFGAL